MKLCDGVSQQIHMKETNKASYICPRRIAGELVGQLNEEYHPVSEKMKGAFKNRGFSTLSRGAASRAGSEAFKHESTRSA